MTVVSKNVYINKLGEIFNKYNNIYHQIITMNRADVKVDNNIDLDVENNNKNPNFRVSDHVRISKYKKHCKAIHTKSVQRRFFSQKC